MAAVDEARGSMAGAGERWYALDPADIAARLSVDPAAGLSAARAADLLAKNGPNALPVEQPPSAIRRFLAEYTSYMQIILVGAAIVSLVIQQVGHAAPTNGKGPRCISRAACSRLASVGLPSGGPAGRRLLDTCRTSRVRHTGEVGLLRRYCHDLWRMWSSLATSMRVMWSSCPEPAARSWSRRYASARAGSSSRWHQSVTTGPRPNSSSR